jgi:hypothetical protein
VSVENNTVLPTLSTNKKVIKNKISKGDLGFWSGEFHLNKTTMIGMVKNIETSTIQATSAEWLDSKRYSGSGCVASLVQISFYIIN